MLTPAVRPNRSLVARTLPLCVTHIDQCVLLSVPLRSPFPGWMRNSCAQRRNSGGPGLSPRLELGQAKTLSFIGIVIALYLVGKGSELLRLDVRKELDVQGALPISIDPSLARWLIQLFGGGPEQSPDLLLALAGEPYGRRLGRSGSRRGGSRIGCGRRRRRRSGSGIGCGWRRIWGAGVGAFDGRCLWPGDRPRGRHVAAVLRGRRGEGTGKVVSKRSGLLTSPGSQQHETHRNSQDHSDYHFIFPRLWRPRANTVDSRTVWKWREV